MFTKVFDSLERMVKYEKNLVNTKFTMKPREEVVNHQLARRISQKFHNVDIEYDIDQTTGGKKAVHELGKALRPDIIVHSRGDNLSNLTVIECKWNANKSRILKDLYKLVYFNLSYTYDYDYSIFVNYEHRSKIVTRDLCVINTFDDIGICAKKLSKKSGSYAANIIVNIPDDDAVVVKMIYSIFGKFATNLDSVEIGDTNSEFILKYNDDSYEYLYIIDGNFLTTTRQLEEIQINTGDNNDDE